MARGQGAGKDLWEGSILGRDWLKLPCKALGGLISAEMLKASRLVREGTQWSRRVWGGGLSSAGHQGSSSREPEHWSICTCWHYHLRTCVWCGETFLYQLLFLSETPGAGISSFSDSKGSFYVCGSRWLSSSPCLGFGINHHCAAQAMLVSCTWAWRQGMFKGEKWPSPFRGRFPWILFGAPHWGSTPQRDHGANQGSCAPRGTLGGTSWGHLSNTTAK